MNSSTWQNPGQLFLLLRYLKSLSYDSVAELRRKVKSGEIFI